MPLTSRQVLFLLYLLMLSVHFFYYPKWKKQGTEATLSWDVSGYYMYLPATFIYKDIKKCGFKDEIIEKYRPTWDFQQAFVHEASGNYVMKYSIGQSIQYAPFFFIGHAWASLSDQYPADGFSFPYQFMISMGALVVALLGLIFIRKGLLEYFEDKAVSWTMIGMVLGSNYLNYTAIGGAMTHNHVFTIYAVLIYLTIQFYKNPNWKKAVGIGALVGLAALTRPTEILGCLIPILWGTNLLDKSDLAEKMAFFKKHLPKLITAIVVCAGVGMIQLGYWKYASGDWFVYSYEDQGFSWLRPHIIDGMFSFKSGWLAYSPFMVFSLVGFYFLYRKNKQLFWPTFVFSVLFIYVAFAWDIWWYGGSLGQRTMVQSYAILAFPLAAFFESYVGFKKWIKIVLGFLIAFFFYLNIWFTHQAHLGGIYVAEQMTKPYYLRVVGRFEKNPEHLKLLDTKEIFEGTPADLKTVYDAAGQLFELDKTRQNVGPISIPVATGYDWLRVSADFFVEQREDNIWTATQWIVRFMNNGEKVQQRMLRLQRHIDYGGQTKPIYFDVPFPKKDFDAIEVNFWNANGDKYMKISGLKAEVFRN